MDISRLKNYVKNPITSMPDAKDSNTRVFLVSNSFEYEMKLVESMLPPSRINYKDLYIPLAINNPTLRVNYSISGKEFNRRVDYVLNNLKSVTPIKPVMFSKKEDLDKAKNPLYVSMTGYMQEVTNHLRKSKLDNEKLISNMRDIVWNMMNVFNMTDPKKMNIMVVDIDRYDIFKNYDIERVSDDVLNGFLSACCTEGISKKLNLIIVFRSISKGTDYKVDFNNDLSEEQSQFETLLSEIGTVEVTKRRDDTAAEDEVVEKDISIEDEMESLGDEEVSDLQHKAQSVSKNTKSTLNALHSKYGVPKGEVKKDTLYYAKSMKINAELLSRINTTKIKESINNYEHISSDLETPDTDDVSKKYLDDAGKILSNIVKSDEKEESKHIVSSKRELALRNSLSQIKLDKNDIEKLSNVTDMPMPEPQRPRNISTTNQGVARGSGFPNASRTYEKEMMDKDIVAVFNQLEKLPDGFDVLNIEVSDISTISELVKNWKVTLKSKQSGLQNVINVRIPIVKNGEFFSGGKWFNIGKQDFPIPILKVNPKKVILTTNYNKISVNRYDTKSLVDVGMLVKLIDKETDANGVNKYVKPGGSTYANSSYMTTIEFDEFAKRWSYIKCKETHMEIYFNMNECFKKYGFVTVAENEFCCGMVNKVPVVINTESGLTRENKTLTEVILDNLPQEIREAYMKQKPTKVHMYSEILIGIKIPLGVACCAWEGITEFLNKTRAEHKYVDKSFNDLGYIKIPFKDKVLAIKNTLSNQLLFNGLYKLPTKSHTVAEFDVPIMDQSSIYIDIFDQLFFTTYSQLTTFISRYKFFVDPITYEVCNHYNLPNDLVGMLIYASNILCDNEHVDETNASLYRIRSTEIIPAILHYNLAVAVSKYNNTSGSKARGNKLSLTANCVINDLMNVETVAPISALNPIVELHTREAISKKGYAGVNESGGGGKVFTVQKRSFDKTMISKIAMSTPNSAEVGVSRQLVVDPNIESIRGYTRVYSPDDPKTDLQLSSFSELLTPGTVARDDAIRTAIACSQSSHIISTEDAEPAIVSNGVDEIVPSYLSEEFAVVADEDGKVIDMNDQFIVVEYKSKTKKAIQISPKYSFNSGSGFYVNNKLKTTFEVGDNFKEGDILAFHEKFFHKGSDGVVRQNIGPMAKVAFTDTYSTYEDAGVVTHAFSKRLGTTLTMCQQIKINATDQIDSVVKVGDVVEIGDPLVLFGLGDTGDKSVDAFLKAFSSDKINADTAKRVIKAKHAGTVVDVRMYTSKAMDKLSPSLFELLSEHFKENKKRRKMLDKYDSSASPYKLDTLYARPTEPMQTDSINGINTDVLIEIYIEHADEASVGDKLAVYAASKQIISEVIPEGLEPFSETRPDEEISVFVSSTSCLRRMIASPILIGAANKVMIELKRQLEEIYNS